MSIRNYIKKQTLEARTNGIYAVVIDNGDCSFTSDCFGVKTVGLDKNEIANINVYPNPTSGIITITSSSTFSYIKVLNTFGKIVYCAKLNHLNTYQLELPEVKGVYLIKVSGDYNTNTYRIIKN